MFFPNRLFDTLTVADIMIGLTLVFIYWIANKP